MLKVIDKSNGIHADGKKKNTAKIPLLLVQQIFTEVFTAIMIAIESRWIVLRSCVA